MKQYVLTQTEDMLLNVSALSTFSLENGSFDDEEETYYTIIAVLSSEKSFKSAVRNSGYIQLGIYRSEGFAGETFTELIKFLENDNISIFRMPVEEAEAE